MKNKKIKLTNSNLGGGGYSSNKIKAFTLIELLAIIVILAIIAVITVPIILNIIENSRKGAAIDSAYGYKDAISKYYITELAKDPNYDELNGTYTVTGEGKLTLEDKTIEISFSGTSPKGGSLIIDKGTVTEGCLTIGDYALTLTNSEVTETKKGACNDSSLGDGGEQGDQPQYKSNIIFPEDENETYIAEVYLDPTDLDKECTAEEAKENSTTGKNEGCMRWFVYKESDSGNSSEGTYTMILDHNTTATVAWVSENDYNSADTTAGEVGITYSGGSAPEGSYGSYGNNNKGPLTVLAKLKEDTSTWQTDVIQSSDNYNPENSFEWTIDYSSKEYKARLITAEEVAAITKENRAKGSSAIEAPEDPWTLGSSWFLLDKVTAQCWNDDNCDETKTISKYWWLFNNLGSDGDEYSCKTYGCKEGLESDPYGYWTSSPDAGYSYYAWRVSNNGILNSSNVDKGAHHYGVRPVITVSKSKFLQ